MFIVLTMERAHVFFSGHVQGVFFRAFVKENAEKLGIKGWVRNLTNGDVEAVFEGEYDKIMELIEICRTKHPEAIVTDVKIKWEKPEYLDDFKIIR